MFLLINQFKVYLNTLLCILCINIVSFNTKIITKICDLMQKGPVPKRENFLNSKNLNYI